MTNEKNDDTLAGFEFGTPAALYWAAEAGPVEKGVQLQIDALRKQNLIEVIHEGSVVLALSAARDVDRSAGRGAPSGRANLLRAMREILEFLPSPAAASGDAVDDVLRAIESMPDDELHPSYVAAS